MSENTNSTTDAVANVDEAADAIADMLTGGEEETTEDQKDEQTSESTDDNEESESNEEETEQETEEEGTEEAESEEGATWAGVLGVEDRNIVLDDSGDFKGVNVKVNGETSTVDMNTLIAGFQSNKHNTNTSKALAEEKKTFEIEKQQVVNDYSGKLDQVKKLTEYAHNKLMEEFQGINWETLRVSDPAEYAASMQDYKARDTELRDIYGRIDTEQSTEQKQKQDQMNQVTQKFLADEIDKMIVNNPAWADREVASKAFTSMSNFLQSQYGFSEAEFNEVKDSRTIEIIKDAMRYRDGKKATAQKMAKPLPKFTKSKGTISNKKKVSKLDKLTKVAKNSSGSDKRRAQVDAVAELLGGG